jgi:hypothetical protein
MIRTTRKRNEALLSRAGMLRTLLFGVNGYPLPDNLNAAGRTQRLKLELFAGRRYSADTGSHRGAHKGWSQQWPADDRANGEARSRADTASRYRSLAPSISTSRENEGKRE